MLLQNHTCISLQLGNKLRINLEYRLHDFTAMENFQHKFLALKYQVFKVEHISRNLPLIIQNI